MTNDVRRLIIYWCKSSRDLIILLLKLNCLDIGVEGWVNLGEGYVGVEACVAVMLKRG